MPTCCGSTRCDFCDIPLCKYVSYKNLNSEKEEEVFHGNLGEQPYNWLLKHVAMYGNTIVNVKVHLSDDDRGILYGKRNKKRYCHKYYKFLHMNCLKILKEKIKNIRIITPILNFFERNNFIEDVADDYDIDSSLASYRYSPCRNKIKYDDNSNFSWLLEDPTINQQNNIRLQNKSNMMLEIYNVYLHFKDFISMFINFGDTKNITSDIISYIIQYFTHEKIHMSLIKNMMYFKEHLKKLKTV